MLDSFFTIVGAFITLLVTVFCLALITGTILWMIYATSIPMLFPNAVEHGILAADLTWWQFVKVTWVFGILIKASNTNNNNKD